MKPLLLSRDEAAAARRSSVVTRQTMPGQRRCAANPGPDLDRMVVRAQIEVRDQADTSSVQYDGYATVYERGYEMWDWCGPYTEVVTAGAGATSLKTPDLDVPLVLQHMQWWRLAGTINNTLQISEDDTGLRTLADLDPTNPPVAFVLPNLRSGLFTEMSFAFRIVEGIWSPDFTEYRINTYDIHRGDTAIVGFGANPYTSGGLRADEPDLRALLRDASDTEARAILGDLLQRFPGKRNAYVPPALEPHRALIL